MLHSLVLKMWRGSRLSPDHVADPVGTVAVKWFLNYGVTFLSAILLTVFHDYLFVPYLRRTVGGISPWRSEFFLTLVHAGFVVDEMPVRQVLSEYFGLPYQF
jgi:hypothetical protein